MNDRYPTAATQSRGDFRSDNVAMVEPSIMAAVLAANTGTQPPYGADEYSTLLDARFSELFEATLQGVSGCDRHGGQCAVPGGLPAQLWRGVLP